MSEPFAGLVSLVKDPVPLGWPFRGAGHLPLRHGTVDGVAWAIARGGPRGMRTINGYARIPWEGHPWSGCTDYNEIPVEVHGGLTFGPQPDIDVTGTLTGMSEAVDRLAADMGEPRRRIRIPELPPRPATTFADVGGWVGFDTGHAWDAWSREELARWGIVQEKLPIEVPVHVDEWTIWWTGERVVVMAKALAVQIAAAGKRAR